jgi:hypothetical protein
MTVRTFQPQINVVLKKNIGRANVAGNIAASTRFTGTVREIDLTPFLGDGAAVATHKSVSEPAGMFSITLVDNFAPGQFESLYGIIEPMDVVEIRMAHDTSLYAGAFTKHMPIIMRGFVTNVRRSEEMVGGAGDAAPSRRVIITGQDYAKLLLINQIAYLPNMVTGQQLLTYFKLFVNYGVGGAPDQDASQFVIDVVNKVVSQFIASMRAAATANGVAQGITPLLDIQVDATVTGGIVSPFGTNQWPGGTIYDLMKYFGDVGPWNELFIEDREDGVFLVYRPTPYKDAAGNFIQDPYKSGGPSSGPAVNIVTDQDLIAIDLERTDEGVANYYWVDNPSYQLIQSPVLQAAIANSSAPDEFFLSDYPNSSPALYGFRRLMLASQQGPRFDGQTQATFNQKNGTAVGFINKRRQILTENNRDNVVFEEGAMRLRGNEAIKAGTYLRLIRGANAVGATLGSGFTADYYVTAVDHQFVPFKNFVTTVLVARGTGFIERAKRGNGVDAPYLAEISPRGVYG